jgi:hypothetical protein
MAESETKAGHRSRLRKRFLETPGALSHAELVELLLTYAIPRRDVAPEAAALIAEFGSLEGILNAPFDELVRVSGVGRHSAVLIKLVRQLTSYSSGRIEEAPPMPEQPHLIEVEPTLGPLFDEAPPVEPEMRTYANDEIANALEVIPQAAQFASFEAFKTHLVENLPYNSESTRKRRTSYILERFFPEERLDTPLTYYATHCSSQEDLKPAIFYHVLKAEPLAAKVAEGLIWPALPVGRAGREDVRGLILRQLPDASTASQAKMLQALFRTYELLSVAAEDGTGLRFHIHEGTLQSFVYVLMAELPEPGIYSFEALEQGPMRHWLLWDREWMRRQLYNLRDLGIISKISEIDTIRQFTLQLDQCTALRHYFENSEVDEMALRERPTT